MDWDDTPGSLDEELDHEAGGRQAALRGGQDPGGDEAAGDERSANDGATTSKELRAIAKYGAADAGACLHEDRSTVGTGGAEVLRLLHESGVAILASVRVEVEPGHEEDAVKTHAPLLLEHSLGLDPESTRCLSALASLLGLNELLGFRECDADETNGNGESSTNPEDGLPRLHRIANTQVGTRSEHVSKGVSLLEDTRHKTTSIGGTVLKSHGDGVTVDTAHEETKKGADSKELLEGGGVDGGDLEKTKNDHIQNHGPFSTKFVTRQAEECSTD